MYAHRQLPRFVWGSEPPHVYDSDSSWLTESADLQLEEALSEKANPDCSRDVFREDPDFKNPQDSLSRWNASPPQQAMSYIEQ